MTGELTPLDRAAYARAGIRYDPRAPMHPESLAWYRDAARKVLDAAGPAAPRPDDASPPFPVTVTLDGPAGRPVVITDDATRTRVALSADEARYLAADLYLMADEAES